MDYANENTKSKYLLRALISLVLLAFAIFVQLTFNVFGVFFPAELTEESAANDNIYVSVTLDRVYPTGYRMTSGGSDLGSYYYGIYEGRCLFCVLPTSTEGKEDLNNYKLVGKIRQTTGSDKSILNKISEDHKLNSASLYATSYSFVITHITGQMLLDMFIAALVLITMGLSAALILISLVKAAKAPTSDNF